MASGKSGFFTGVLAGLTLGGVGAVYLATAFPMVPTPVETASVTTPPVVAVQPAPTSDPVAATPNVTAPAMGNSTIENGNGASDLALSGAPTPTPAVPQPVAAVTPTPTVATTPANTQTAAVPTGSFNNSDTAMATPASSDQNEPVELAAATPAFEAFSQVFVHSGDKPLLSIILVVENVAEINAVASLGFPVTVAIDSNNPNAEALIKLYRQHQGEALLFLTADGNHSIRSGDDASMVNGTLELAMPKTTGVIGILDAPGGSMAGNITTVVAVLDAVAETGLAVVSSPSRGADLLKSEADKIGWPAASISHQIDVSGGQIDTVREVEAAAQGAVNAGSTTVFGYASSDTISALGYWKVSPSTQLVTLAPVSALINQ